MAYKPSAWMMCLSTGLALSMAGSVLAQNQPDRGKKDVKPAATQPVTTPAKPETTKAQPAKDVKAGAPDPAMAAMVAAAEPGPNHKLLEKFVGKWEGTVKMWMEPGQTPSESPSTITHRMELGGRYLHTHAEGTASEFGKFEGMGVMGYNNVLKQFQSGWVDNMSTSVERLNGTYDPATKTYTFTGEVTCPIAGHLIKVRDVIKWTGEDSYTEEFYRPDPAGKEFKGMELSFKRTSRAVSEAHEAKEKHKTTSSN